MPAGFTPQGMTPFDAQRVARNRVPERYPILGFGIIGLYFVLTIVVAVIRFGMDLHEPVSDLTPPTPPGFEGVAPERARPPPAADDGEPERRLPPPAFDDKKPDQRLPEQWKPRY